MTDQRHINCDECQQRLEEFALDELSEVEGLLVRDHLTTGCYVCNLQLAQIVADWSISPSLLPAELPPLRIERELMQSIAGKSPRPQMSSATPIPETDLRPVARPSSKRLITAALAIAGSLLAFAAWTSWHGGNGSNASHDLAGEAAYQAEIERRVRQADHSQHFSSIPELNFAYVNDPARAKPVHGYIVADEIARQMHLYTFDLPALAEGRAYEVWLVAKDGQFISAGRLEIDAEGTANKIIDVPADAPQVTGIAISDEPTVGSPKPTGPNFVKADLP